MLTNAAARAVLEALTNSIWITNGHLRLFVNEPALGPGMSKDDFIEAGYDGYAGQKIATDISLSDIYPADNGRFERRIEGGSVQFIAGAVAAPFETVRGWYITDDVGDVVQAAYLPTPITMDAPGKPVEMQISYGLTAAGAISQV